MRSARLPPGPVARFPGQLLYIIGRNPLRFISMLAHGQGDVSAVRIGTQRIYFVKHPDHIRDVLVTNQRIFHKSRGLERAKMLLGEGLLTSEGDFHLRQRRLAQPAFHRQRVAAYADTMSTLAARRAERWHSGEVRDIASEMSALTLAVVGKTLFDADVEAEAPEIGEALTAALEMFNLAVLPFSEILEIFPFGPARRFRRARSRLDATIYRLIAERRARPEDRGDLLSMLLLARDEEGDRGSMSDRQLRDEAMTIFLAGHETTANALTWTWYLLSQHSEVEAQLHAEVDALGKDILTADDLERLPYTRKVIAESMRLYPPAWALGRRATEDYAVGGYDVPRGSVVLMSQYVTHRDARFHPDPERFDPERWAPEAIASRPRFSYFPFGAGTRVCIGEQFAWMEAILILATLARGWRLRLVPEQRIAVHPLITLRPKYGMRMRLEARR